MDTKREELDEKLEEIFVNDSKRKGLHDGSYTNYVVTPSVIVPQIKQAFKDAGYIKVPQQVEDTWREYNRMAGYMTGQEFYGRFEREYEKLEAGGHACADCGTVVIQDLLSITKKAAGLDTGTRDVYVPTNQPGSIIHKVE